MEFDFWWLLIIPLVFGLGWLSARFELKLSLSNASKLPNSYFRGLNFLLNEQPDKAISAFIEIVKLDPETTELYFALGNLFRRRGETERAIRVHQNLLNRQDLPVLELNHAYFELGQDFLKAGLLDQAENTFMSIKSGPYKADAQRSLLTLYQIQRDWELAIATAKVINNADDNDAKLVIALSHFYCELAELALKNNSADQANQYLNQSIKINPSNARAIMLLGDCFILLNKIDHAIIKWSELLESNARYLPLIAKRLLQAYETANRAQEGLDKMSSYLQTHANSDLLDSIYPSLLKTLGIEKTHELLILQMQRYPSISSMVKLLEMLVKNNHNNANNCQIDLDLVTQFIKKSTKNLPRYICTNCGFRARLFYWQCPGCQHWESFNFGQTKALTPVLNV